MRFLLFISMASLSLCGCAGLSGANPASQVPSASSLSHVFGTYDAEPRLPNGRVDTDRLVAELVAIKANTYNFLVWRATNDWDDFQLFLPKAREKGIKVWITIVPPSESPPHTRNYSEPFRLDYQRWATEIAQLSLQEPNLVAWSLDDFSYSSETFTLEYVTQMVGRARAINPRLAFVPCLYYGHVTPELGEKYRPLVNGILFPYRHEAGKRNLSEWDTLPAEIARIKERFGSQLPVFVDVYATKHSQLNDSSPEYVEQVMKLGWQHADGVLIYCHQYEDKSPEKYHVIKRLFADWSAQDTAGGGLPK